MKNWGVIEEIKKRHKNKKLVKKFPFLKPHWANREAYHYQTTILDNMPLGWKVAFGEMMAFDLLKACKKDDIDPNDLKFIEVKEKYGSLRCYTNITGSNIQNVLDDYEQVSQNICCICGKIDTPQLNNGWMVPVCKKCYKEKLHVNGNYEKNVNLKNSIIPDYYTVHKYNGISNQYVNYDLTWITKRLRGEK